MRSEDIAERKAFRIDSEQYIRCVEYREQVCPTFAHVEVDEEACRAQWPEHRVRAAIIQGAVVMDTLDSFQPTLDGPAKMKAPTRTLPTDDDRQQPEYDDDETAAAERDNASTHPQRGDDDAVGSGCDV
jgi:hypothetical protein